ncbi:AIPR family protein [Christiangramia sp. ASW11-125]|uniref:AIPR family protein n=1 Tax=Christiangramia sp. ASW11-125 TaxID=3400701 RepID=UPI003AAA534E
MSIFKVLEKSIENFSDQLSDKKGDILKGSEFMLFALTNIFRDKDLEEIEQGIVDSSYRGTKYDFGIDAIYITASNDFIEQPEELEDYNEDTKFKIHIFQFKRGTGISQADLLKFKKGIQKVLIDESLSDEDNLYFYNRMLVLNEIKSKLFSDLPAENIHVINHIVFGGIESNIHSEKILTDEIEDIEKALKDNGYTTTACKITDCEALIKGPSKHQFIIDIIEYEKTFKYITDTDKKNKLNGYISIISGKEIAELVKKHQSSIFEANIRDYFKRSDLNSKIIETSSSEEEAKYFWSYNNGLTMTCSKVEELPNNKYKLHNLQIVNGCQTSNAIYSSLKNKERIAELLEKKANGGLNKKETEELTKKEVLQFNEDTSLLVKIIETNNEDLIYRITETTNSQTPIKAFSLKANDDIQKLIEKFLEDYGVAYERRINELRNKGKKNIYSIQKLFQLFTSQILLKPSQVKTRPKMMFVSTYDDVFPAPNVKSINYLLYYIPILIDLSLNKAIKKYRAENEIDNYRKTLLSYGKFHLGCFLLSSIVKKDYSEKGLIKKESHIKKEIEDNLDSHFENALDNFEKVMKTFAGNKKESIPSAVRKTDLDKRIAKYVKNVK